MQYGSTNWAGSGGCSTDGVDLDYSSAIGSAVIDVSADGIENQFTLTTSVVQGWIASPSSNSGMVIFVNDTSGAEYVHSSESATSSYRPKLVVDYTSSGVKYRRTISPFGARIGSRQAA